MLPDEFVVLLDADGYGVGYAPYGFLRPEQKAQCVRKPCPGSTVEFATAPAMDCHEVRRAKADAAARAGQVATASEYGHRIAHGNCDGSCAP